MIGMIPMGGSSPNTIMIMLNPVRYGDPSTQQMELGVATSNQALVNLVGMQDVHNKITAFQEINRDAYNKVNRCTCVVILLFCLMICLGFLGPFLIVPAMLVAGGRRLTDWNKLPPIATESISTPFMPRRLLNHRRYLDSNQGTAKPSYAKESTDSNTYPGSFPPNQQPDSYRGTCSSLKKMNDCYSYSSRTACNSNSCTNSMASCEWDIRGKCSDCSTTNKCCQLNYQYNKARSESLSRDSCIRVESSSSSNTKSTYKKKTTSTSKSSQKKSTSTSTTCWYNSTTKRCNANTNLFNPPSKKTGSRSGQSALMALPLAVASPVVCMFCIIFGMCFVQVSTYTQVRAKMDVLFLPWKEKGIVVNYQPYRAGGKHRSSVPAMLTIVVPLQQMQGGMVMQQPMQQMQGQQQMMMPMQMQGQQQMIPMQQYQGQQMMQGQQRMQGQQMMPMQQQQMPQPVPITAIQPVQAIAVPKSADDKSADDVREWN